MLPVATLVYETPAESACPDEATFRAAVSARLGHDPFVVGAERTVLVRLSGSGSSWLATVRVAGAEASDERRIEASGSCEELAAGAALAVSIAIDPLGTLDGSPEPASEPQPTLEPEPQAKRAPTPRTEPAPPARPIESSWHVRAAARIWLEAVPAVSGGPVLGGRYRHGPWSLGLAGFGVLPRRETAEGERAVSASLWGIELEPCAHVSVWRGCAVLHGGVLFGAGHGVDVPANASTWHATAGASLGYELALGRVHVVPTVTGAARLRTTTLSLADETIWVTPRWILSAGVELDYRL